MPWSLWAWKFSFRYFIYGSSIRTKAATYLERIRSVRTSNGGGTNSWRKSKGKNWRSKGKGATGNTLRVNKNSRWNSSRSPRTPTGELRLHRATNRSGQPSPSIPAHENSPETRQTSNEILSTLPHNRAKRQLPVLHLHLHRNNHYFRPNHQLFHEYVLLHRHSCRWCLHNPISNGLETEKAYKGAKYRIFHDNPVICLWNYNTLLHGDCLGTYIHARRSQYVLPWPILNCFLRRRNAQ